MALILPICFTIAVNLQPFRSLIQVKALFLPICFTDAVNLQPFRSLM
jgi:hypothetical protein